MAGKPRTIIDFDKIYSSNSCGDFKIIEDMGRDDRSRLYVKVKFLDSGTEKIARYDLAMDGRILDDLYNIDFNKVYYSMYYGPFNIIEYIGRNAESKRIVRIKFINTGFECNVLLRFVLSGQVLDPSVTKNNRIFPSITEIPRNTYDSFITNVLKTRWGGMMQRCYNPNNEAYNEYGGIGVTVDKMWQNFDCFLITVRLIKNYNKFYFDPINYHIDKDYLQQNIPNGKRVYSPYTCVFLSNVDNSNLAMLEHRTDEIFGVKEIGNNRYMVEFSINGKKKSFGVYDDMLAAAVAYNYYYIQFANFKSIPLLNKNLKSYMSFEEAQKHLIR